MGLSGLQADQLLLIDDTPENIVAARAGMLFDGKREVH
ncbi:hypothetical protein NOJ05_30720 [Neorhizobium galegae]|nr:hypothetical protein [Neorhizobium galegae]MCQ1781569.1 hypothetical protein [Neorhizobium galegae]MCQ1799045.1 hypothetical protein [Neorhizobium galegae]